MKKYFCALLLCSSILASYSQPGSLDLSFGGSGYVITSISPLNDEGHRVVIQKDQKIIVAGWTQLNDPAHVGYAMIRYNSDGSYDTSFGVNGIVITSFFLNDIAYAYAVALQNTIHDQSKILMTGGAGSLGFTTLRYNHDGTIDNTFGISGRVSTHIGMQEYEEATSMLIQNDNKIIIAGSALDSTFDPFIVLVRYNIDGSLDSSFGNGGKVITNIGSGCGSEDITLQIDQKIIVAGQASFGGSPTEYVISRYNTNGSLDTAFGLGGIVNTDLGYTGQESRHVVIQDDGKIVVAGIGNHNKTVIMRYNLDGTLDSFFGTGGHVITISPNNPNIHFSANSISLQSDGKLIVAASEANGWPNDSIAIIRYNTDGSIDNTFGHNGFAKFYFGTTSYGIDLAVQNDGKIVCAGSASTPNNPSFLIFRINADSLSTFVNEIDNNIEINLFPVPANDILNIPESNINNIEFIKISDLLGKQRYFSDTPLKSINTSFLEEGIYFIELKEKYKTPKVLKFVISR